MSELVHVAVGVIQGADGRILIAQRPQHTHQGGLWEFPGGKLAAGENTHQALVRELQEELAIETLASEPLIQIHHDYGDKQVLLDVHRVTRFSGEARGAEGQPLQWVAVDQLHNYAFPAANRPIITALRLPQKLLITGEAQSHKEYLAAIASAAAAGARGVQLRCPGMSAQDYLALASDCQQLCDSLDLPLFLNTSPEIFAQSQAQALHLNSHWLQQLTSRPVAPEILLGASCHNPEELRLAQILGVDYVSLSSVNVTSSHPDAEPLGWEKFAALVQKFPLPVYALGGLTEADLPRAIAAGAQGVAAISCWWPR